MDNPLNISTSARALQSTYVRPYYLPPTCPGYRRPRPRPCAGPCPAAAPTPASAPSAAPAALAPAAAAPPTAPPIPGPATCPTASAARVPKVLGLGFPRTSHENFPLTSGLVHASVHATRQTSSAWSASARSHARSHAAKHPLSHASSRVENPVDTSPCVMECECVRGGVGLAGERRTGEQESRRAGEPSSVQLNGNL
jgi:hypothetical protein